MSECIQESENSSKDWLKRVQWAFLQMVPITYLKSILDEKVLNVQNQEELYGLLFRDSYVVKYPLSQSYRYKVVKLLVSVAENCREEVFEPLLEIVLNSISVKDKFVREESHLTYGHINCDRICTTRIIYPSNEVGLMPWEAGHFLAEYALANPSLFKEKRILELGSGIGLTGLTIAAQCSPEEILMTDHNDEVIANLRYNVRINEEEGHVDHDLIKVACLDWLEGLSLQQNHFDVVMAADCVYDPDSVPALVKLVKTCLSVAKPDSKAIFATSRRNMKTFELFKNVMNEASFEWRDESEKVTHLKTLFSPSCSVMLNRNPKREDIKLYVAKLRGD